MIALLCPQGRSSCCRLAPGCGRTSRGHGPEKWGSEVLLLTLGEPRGSRKCRGAQTAYPEAGTSHSSQVLVHKTHASTMSLESNNLIMALELCLCMHTALSQLPRPLCDEHGTGRRSGQLGSQTEHPSTEPYEECLSMSATTALVSLFRQYPVH